LDQLACPAELARSRPRFPVDASGFAEIASPLMRFAFSALGLAFAALPLVWGGEEKRSAVASVADAPEGEPLVWGALDPWQGTLRREAFERLMEELYAPGGRWRPWMEIDEPGVRIRQRADEPEAVYRFAFGDRPPGLPAAAAAARPEGLEGLRVAIDPGHIGGDWGEMEERSFAIGDRPRVQEGDLCLAAARRLKALLERRGAAVWLAREAPEPVTALRPEHFVGEAKRRLDKPEDDAAVRELAERLFYREAEIRERARRLNEEFQADLALVLHINAGPWPEAEERRLVEENSGHVLVHGAYLPGELADDVMRLQLWRRLVAGYHRVERPLAAALAEAMVEATGLPPYRYEGDNALQIDEAGYVWARNLLANRIYDCPVVYLEPWTLNSEAVYPWAALGDYEGERLVGGRSRPSLPAVYAAFVLEGLERYYEAGKSEN